MNFKEDTLRDKERIRKFCNEFADIWEANCSDWRFGQLMMNVLGAMQSGGRDPFFPDEDEMITYFKQYFSQGKHTTPYN